MKSIKNIFITFFIGCIVFVIGNLLSDGFSFGTVRGFLIEFSFYQLYAFVLGYSNMFYFSYLEQRKWNESDTIKRIVIGVLGSVVITIIGLVLLRTFTALYYFGQTFDYFIAHETLKPYQFGLWITLTIVITFHFIYFYNKYQQKKIKEQKVIAGTASAKFDALKNQLDPHFLFNSLNVLTSLIEENPDNAQKFTTSLSKVYRYVLEQKNKDLVTVDEELAFAKTYMSLLKTRFEDSIIFEIPDQASNPESKVVPLSLQLLLENAVKHNMVTSAKPLHIKIYEENGNLVVENNLQPKQIVKKSSGVGLSNIKQRYDLLTDKKVFINQEAKSFAVAIPMLTKQITVMKKLETPSEQSYERARKHVENLKGFYYSIVAYCVVIPFIIFINYKTSWEFHWFWFPLFGWGIGICFHAYQVFVNDGVLGISWEQRKIEQYMKEEENKKKWN
ncbi:histidine kinase [Lacinutrix iliipiscaria]|uniref:Histidine kinase n=1 Tax=Lacinutrix iliipiscaria TaxID=1230532 RepID=A0ABW5WNE8_9FLAO